VIDDAATERVFSPRLLLGWVGVAVLLFAATVYAISGGRLPSARHPGLVGPSTYSRSAIGYAGLAELLRRRGATTISSQYDVLAKLSPGSVLVVAEPQIQSEDLIRALLAAKRILLVLPKWAGRESAGHTGWITEAEPLSALQVQATLALVAGRGDIIRRDEPGNWTVNTLGIEPTIAAPLQLIKSERLQPLIASETGVLLGWVPDANRRIWILADPDILENHGLLSGRNAELALAIFDRLRAGDSRIVFDETVHGFTAAAPSSPLLLLFRFPFIVATTQAALAIALLLWATMGRFGAPETVPPPLAAGKQGLIRNAARLLESAGDQPVIMQRYVHALIRDVASQLHAPAGMAGAALLDWLNRVGKARGLSDDLAALCREVDVIATDKRREPASLIARVAEAHRWKQGIVDGIGEHSRHH
jgi:hypothetical protein